VILRRQQGDVKEKFRFARGRAGGHAPARMGDELLPGWAIDGIAAREPESLAACYEAFAEGLYRYLLSRCGDPTLAEELVEDTFLELVDQAPALTGGGGGVRAWLFRAGRNNLIDARRKVLRRGDVAYDEQRAAQVASPHPGPEEAALAGATAARVQSALARLSQDQRDVLLLRFAGELSGPEVAAVLGKTVGAVKALQHRGLAALGRILTEEGAPSP
jgi:RNA polymerase sigma-70 factor, ECF subfamily